MFVNVPQSERFDAPDSLLVRAIDMPVIETASWRVKVALGESNGVRGAVSPSGAMTILDGIVQPGGQFSHLARSGSGIWVQAIDGSLDVSVGEDVRSTLPGQAIAISADRDARIEIGNRSREPAHFALFDGAQIGETYVQDGPFEMGSIEQIAEIKAAYKAGLIRGIAGK